ncbi:NADH:flavin oxidoreductase [bacterium]|nr:NADH:flavin oxidoreductase [Chloroflexi bacterium CFX6]RIL11196.1 MAG: NADH:flavin oxidoreductase [bacterium]
MRTGSPLTPPWRLPILVRVTSSPTPAAPPGRLFEPIDLRGLVVPNRIVLTAMVTRLSGEDGVVNAPIVERYARFAAGGAGLIVVEATAVHEARSGPLLRLGDDRFVPGHRALVDRVRDAGPSKVALQIIHFLKIARSGWRQTVDMLGAAELRGIVDAYAAAAARTRAAGYDAVELHMAHAYTLSSFLSRLNRRHDAYGGRSLEGRMRLATEVVLAVRRAVGDDYPVGVRFDGEECVKGGYGLAESTQIGLRMAQLGVDYLSISAGGKFEDAVPKPGEPLYPYTGYSGDRTMPAAQYPDGANVYLAAGIRSFLRAHGHATPVVAAGKVPTPALAERILRAGEADMIGLARALLADPDWPRKARRGHDDRIVRCVYGNVCKALDENFRQVRCVLWPKDAPHAPTAHPEDVDPPTWPTDGDLRAELRPGGQVALAWERAIDPFGVYGYQVFRRVNDGPFAHLTSMTARRHVDAFALAGNRYAYHVRAYDFAGLRSAPSRAVEVAVPEDYALGDGVDLGIGPVGGADGDRV